MAIVLYQAVTGEAEAGLGIFGYFIYQDREMLIFRAISLLLPCLQK